MGLGRKMGAEFLGSFWLVHGGVGAAVFAERFPEVGVGFIGVSLAFGFAVLTMGYAIGHISGSHLNPTVSIGLFVGGRFERRELLPYLVAQFLGAIVAAALLYLVITERANPEIGRFAANGYGAHSPGGYSMIAALTSESVMAFGFVFIILGATDKRARNPALAPIVAGLALTVIHLVALPSDYASVNPARSTATAVFKGGWALEQLWLFFAAPLGGAVLAGLAYKLIAGTTEAPELPSPRSPT